MLYLFCAHTHMKLPYYWIRQRVYQGQFHLLWWPSSRQGLRQKPVTSSTTWCFSRGMAGDWTWDLSYAKQMLCWAPLPPNCAVYSHRAGCELTSLDVSWSPGNSEHLSVHLFFCMPSPLIKLNFAFYPARKYIQVFHMLYFLPPSIFLCPSFLSVHYWCIRTTEQVKFLCFLL